MKLPRTLKTTSEALPFSEAYLDYPFIASIVRAIGRVPPARMASWRRKLARLRSGKDVAIHDGKNVTADVIAELEESAIPASIDHSRAITDGAATLLVFAFLERTLRAIAEHIASESAVASYVRKHKRSGGTIRAYLGFIEAECGFGLRLSAEMTGLLDRERAVRNDFAHGDWLRHYFVSNRRNGIRSLLAASKLILEVERAYLLAYPEV